MNKGSKIIVTIIAPKPPKATKRMASFDLPSNTILWPGKIDSAVASSGTPRKIEGINSKRACEIAIETKKTHKNSKEKIFKRKAVDAKTIAPTVFTWKPGIKPVIAPHKIPIIQARMRSKISINPAIIKK